MRAPAAVRTAFWLALIGGVLVVAAPWLRLYTVDGHGATPFQMRRLGEDTGYGTVIPNAWIMLLVAGGAGAFAAGSLVAVTGRRTVRWPFLLLGSCLLIVAVVLAATVQITVVADRDGIAYDLVFAEAFSLVFAGIAAWLGAVVLTLVAWVMAAPTASESPRGPAGAPDDAA